MTEEYTDVTISNNNESTLRLPDTKFTHILGESIGTVWQVKSPFKDIRIFDANGKQVGCVEKNSVATINIAKPYWWQFIKRIKGEKRWVIE